MKVILIKNIYKKKKNYLINIHFFFLKEKLMLKIKIY
jgi:hypothetical protein